jgi:hypothetical protein
LYATNHSLLHHRERNVIFSQLLPTPTLPHNQVEDVIHRNLSGLEEVYKMRNNSGA